MSHRTLQSDRPFAALAAALVALALAAVAPIVAGQNAPDRRTPAAASAAADPWLGLRVTPVPDALAAHLPLRKGEQRIGLMVRNVVKDGPADRGGLRRYDVILAINDKPVVDALGRFVRQVSRLQPGKTAKLAILRAGERASVTLTVGRSQPDADRDYAYRYPEAPSGVMQQRNRFAGAVITRDESGWRWEDLDQADAEALADLPPEMLDRLRRFAAFADPAAPSQRTVIQRGDRTVEIVRDGDGGITVRSHRFDAEGEPEALVQTYGSAAAFREADPRAFELQARLAEEPLLPGGAAEDEGAGPGGEEGAAAEDNGQADAEKGDANADGETDDVEAYAAQRRQYQAFLEEYMAYLRQRMDDPDAEGPTPMPMMWRQILDADAERALLPKREFTRDASGRIDVRIRKSSGDLVLSFPNAEAMKQKNPDLYKHYQALVDDQ